jgi:hypothetical protein
MASLQGSVSINTKSIQDAVNKLNKLSAKLKEVSSATSMYEQAQTRKAQSDNKATKAAKDQERAEKAKSDLLQRNANLVERAANQLANYTQRVSANVKDEAKRAQMLERVENAMQNYAARVKAAQGDTTKLAAAKTRLSTVTGNLSRELKEQSSSQGSSQKSAVATERALGSLEVQYKRFATAIENSTIEEKIQQNVLKEAKQEYLAARAAIKQYGAGTLQAVQAQNKFRISLADTANNMRNQFKGVGRGAGQAGIQVQQFVGQIQGGVNPMVALSQQAADLGFALGVPLAGAIAGLAFSFGSFLSPEMFETATAAEKLEEALNNVDDVLTDTDEGVVRLSDKILRLAEVSELAAEASLILALREAQEESRKAAEGISDLTGNIGLIQQNEGFTGRIQNEMRELGESFGLSGLEAQKAGQRLSGLIEETRREPSTENLTKLLDTMGNMVKVAGDDLTPEMESLYREIEELSLGAILLNEDATKLEEKLNNLGEAFEDSSESSQKASRNLRSLLDGLQEQVATLGMSERQMAIYEARRNKATEADILFINAQYELIEAEEKKAAATKNEAQQLRILSGLTNKVNEMRGKATAYANANSKADLDAALAAAKNASEIEKQRDKIEALSFANQKILAQRLGLSTQGKTQAQVENEIARAYQNQADAASRAQRGAKALFDFRQQSQKIEGSATGISGIQADFSQQEEQQRQAFGRLLQANDFTDEQRQQYIDQYVTNMQELEKQKNVALSEAMRSGTDAAQISPLSDTERLRQDFEQRKQTLGEIFGEESEMYKSHLASLKNQYEQQNFHMEFAKQAQAANGILGGAMDTMQALGKENSKEYQAMAISQALIQQAMAVNSVWADPSIPFWGKIGLSAMAGMQVAGQIKQIKSQSFATGGFVSGAGTGTSDSIPARLSDGEYVINAAATRMLGKGYLDQLNSGRVPAMNRGGSAGRVPAIAMSNPSQGWGDLSVQVINEGNSEMEATRTEQGYDENGQMQMRIFVRQVVREEMDSGNMDKSMGRNYGVTRKPTRR